MSAIINIDVPDIERAIEFYTAATECQLERRLDDTVAELSCGAVNIYLLEHATGSTANADNEQKRHYSRHWTPVHIDFVVADLDEAIVKAENAGAVRESNVEIWHGATHVTFSDPFGHGFCLIRFREATYELDPREPETDHGSVPCFLPRVRTHRGGIGHKVRIETRSDR